MVIRHIPPIPRRHRYPNPRRRSRSRLGRNHRGTAAAARIVSACCCCRCFVLSFASRIRCCKCSLSRVRTGDMGRKDGRRERNEAHFSFPYGRSIGFHVMIQYQYNSLNGMLLFFASFNTAEYMYVGVPYHGMICVRKSQT